MSHSPAGQVLAAAPPFAVHYLAWDAFPTWLATGNRQILGIVGYGAPRPETLAKACPFLAAALPVAGAGAIYEIWTAPSEVAYRQTGPVAGACAGDIVFGSIELDASGARLFDALVEDAYLRIFDFLEATGYPAPIRFWNYLPGITCDQDGLDCYRRFNVGRHDAFSVRLRLPVPPVATAVGSRDGVPQIFFLAARSPAQAVENPRQISAYAYPPVYGPRSPRFSRACLYGMEAAPVLLISGTASIVGHESRHPGDPAAQIAETLRNFAALIGAVDGLGFPAAKGNWAFKIFLRDPAHRDLVAAAMNRMFDPKFERLFLHADLCRAELLVEIEAVCAGGRG